MDEAAYVEDLRVAEGSSPSARHATLPLRLLFGTDRDPELPDRNFGGFPMFRYRDIAWCWPDMLKRWLTMPDDLRTAWALYIGVLFAQRIYAEHSYLSLVGAAEMYHRLRGKNEIDPAAAHTARITRILGHFKGPDRKWLKGKLSRSNEPSLENRLLELLERNPKLFEQIYEDRGILCKIIARTRNYYSHYAAELQTGAVRDRVELHWLSRVVAAIVEDCLLHELGMSADERRSCIRRFSRHSEAFYRVSVLLKWARSIA
jgi:hypothetical protein